MYIQTLVVSRSTGLLKTFVYLACLLSNIFEYTEPRVVHDMTEWNKCCLPAGCPPLGDIVRNPDEYVKICQYYHGKHYFATLYDKHGRIPVFSYFQIDGFGEPPPRRNLFDNEPQLVNENLPNDMLSFSDLKEKIKKSMPDTNDEAAAEMILQYQANIGDYSSPFHQGHLNPAAGHKTLAAVMATNTYTNVIPQMSKFNQGCWQVIETQIRQYVKTKCRTENHVVVGAVPGTDRHRERINIPSYLWSYVICGNHTMALFVPNTENTNIGNNKLLTLFLFKPNQLGSFLNEMRDLANSVSYLNLAEQIKRVENIRQQSGQRLKVSNVAEIDAYMSYRLGCQNTNAYYMYCRCKILAEKKKTNQKEKKQKKPKSVKKTSRVMNEIKTRSGKTYIRYY